MVVLVSGRSQGKGAQEDMWALWPSLSDVSGRDVLFGGMSRCVEEKDRQAKEVPAMQRLIRSWRERPAVLLAWVRGRGDARQAHQAGGQAQRFSQPVDTERKGAQVQAGLGRAVVVPLWEKEPMQDARISASVSSLWAQIHSDSDQARLSGCEAGSLFAGVRNQGVIRKTGRPKEVPRRKLPLMEGRKAQDLAGLHQAVVSGPSVDQVRCEALCV